ncbi:NAD(P)-binding protein [Suillus fuscotomentosus]|uniref:NAD(P)-binding protein n=1 Tax=Suillus fuscotomentosus TaxID=1912939 RepID=A0AAD4HJ39_9AGAM|nr:NAD(P)-binding protein [Suillus fuscotomentosus]KAG1897374.1 NAD(P)-binding protein [Suillus fuscotomentosus]
MDLGLKNIHVLVTGASGGISPETVKLCLSLDANVTTHHNSNSKPIQNLQVNFPALQCAQADLSSESAVKSMFDALSGTPFGPVAVIVVNHGIWSPQDVPIVDMTIESWDHTISANLTSNFVVCREFLRHLRAATESVKDRAAIVLIGSTSGRVNCIAPGWVPTPMVQEALNDPAVSGPLLAATPLKKFGTPLDVANQIVVVSSSVVSGHVTGQVIFVEGGFLMNLCEE